MALRTRIPDDLLQDLIDNEGLTSDWAEVSPTGVLRLALDLRDARRECARLSKAAKKSRG